MKKTIACKECGKKIQYNGGNHKYCDDCRLKAKKAKKRLWREHHRREHPHLCLNCSKIIYAYKGHNHRYCKTCAELISKELSRQRFLKYYQKWKHVLPPSVGSGYLSPSPRNNFDDDDFTDEFLAVRRELKRLRLKH